MRSVFVPGIDSTVEVLDEVEVAMIYYKQAASQRCLQQISLSEGQEKLRPELIRQVGEYEVIRTVLCTSMLVGHAHLGSLRHTRGWLRYCIDAASRRVSTAIVVRNRPKYIQVGTLDTHRQLAVRVC